MEELRQNEQETVSDDDNESGEVRSDGGGKGGGGGEEEWYLDTSSIMYCYTRSCTLSKLASATWLLGERCIFTAELEDDGLQRPISTVNREEEENRQRAHQD